MSAQAHNLIQGSKDWHEHRKHYPNASEANVMLGISPYKSRDSLLEEKATGNIPKVDEYTQKIFDEGHRLERKALPLAEKIVEDDLFQPIMTKEIGGLTLSASFDGITMLDDIVWEHKTLNKNLKENLLKCIIPESYKPQLEQQMMVSGAEKLLFMASNDDEEYHVWYSSDELLRKRLIAGWKQFAKDLKAWKPTETKLEVVAQNIEELPILSIEIEGGVKRTNLEQYEKTALAFIQNINTDLQTDSDFANATAMVTFCTKAEKDLDQVKKEALEQTADIAALFKTIDTLKEEMRTKRLELNKLVKARKEAIKYEIVQGANTAFAAHIMSLENRLSHVVAMPAINVDFTSATKNKRTVESLRNAVNTELARAKIAANETADLIDDNIKAMLEHAPNHRFLFMDLQQTCTKATDDFIAMVKLRVAAHKELEERKRISEEQAKARLESEKLLKEEAESRCKLAQAASTPAPRRKSPIEELEEMEEDRKEGKPFNIKKYEQEHVSGKCAIDDKSKSFYVWWEREGSLFIKHPAENTGDFVKRVASVAWENGLYCAKS